MMTGKLIINGIDAYTAYGVYVVRGGWNEAAAFPPLKAVKSNDWQEYDGIEPDLSAPVLDTRNITLKFAAKNDAIAHYKAFTAALEGQAVLTVNCAEIGRILVLRMVSHTSVELAAQLGFLSVKFADDHPLNGYTYLAPSSSVATANDYKIDNYPLTRWGVRVLKGSLSSVVQAANVKTALLRNIPSAAGAIFDGGASVKAKSKDAKVKCLLRASSLSELWRNADALLYDLTRAGEHTLAVTALGGSYKFYYKSCSVTQFLPSSLWLEFTLTLTLFEGKMTTP